MRNAEPGWFASLLGAAVLIAGGFALGLVAGVVSEEPDLVVGHLVGRSEEVPWTPEGGPEFTDPEDDARVVGEDADPDEGAVAAGGERPDPLRLAARLDRDEAPPMREIEDPRPTREERRPEAVAPAVEEPEAELPSVASPPPARPAVRDLESLPTASSAPERRGGFAVQVGAFADGGAAESVRRKLAAKGFDSYVIPAAGDGKWRVRVGPVSTRAGADALAGRLKSEERLPTWVLAEGGG